MLKALNKTKFILFTLALVYSMQLGALHAKTSLVKDNSIAEAETTAPSVIDNLEVEDVKDSEAIDVEVKETEISTKDDKTNEIFDVSETTQTTEIAETTEIMVAGGVANTIDTIESIDITEESEEPGLFDIDLWIFFSQTLNFFVLLYILNRFLFKPMGEIINSRQTEIKTIQDNIHLELINAKALKKEYEEELQKIEETAYNLRQRAILEANKKSEDIIKEARDKANKIIEEGEMDVFMERQTAWAQLREDVIQLTMLSTERIVEESLDEEMHRKIIANSIKSFASDLPDFKK